MNNGAERKPPPHQFYRGFGRAKNQAKNPKPKPHHTPALKPTAQISKY